MHAQTLDRERISQTISHVNLHYAIAEDGPAAALLLKTAGLILTQEMELPTGGMFYRFSSNIHALNQGDNIVYLSPLPPATAALMEAARQTLGYGTQNEHPAVSAYHAAQACDPEFNFHVGFLVDSLEFLEERFQALKALEASDPRFAGRLKFLVNRALPGNPEIDTRMDASPVYRGVTRYTYGRNGVQAFCETDLIVDGPLAEGLVLEFDYVFPGYDEHIMAVSERTR